MGLKTHKFVEFGPITAEVKNPYFQYGLVREKTGSLRVKDGFWKHSVFMYIYWNTV